MIEQLTVHAAGTRSLRRTLTSFGRALLLAAPGVVMLCSWQFASGRLVREAYISKPTDIARRLYELFATGEIWPSLKVTGQELVLSYVIGVASGLLIGYALGRSPRVARIVEPYVMAFYGIPKIALAPLFIIWFGIGIWSKVVLAGTMVFFLVFYNVYAGVRAIDDSGKQHRADDRIGRGVSGGGRDVHDSGPDFLGIWLGVYVLARVSTGASGRMAGRVVHGAAAAATDR